MKTTDEIEQGFKNKQKIHEKFALVNYEIRIKQPGYQNFIVPWQIVETEKKEIFSE